MNYNSEFLEETPRQHTEGTMKMMLDPTTLLNDVEVYLKGYYHTTVYDEKTKTSKTIRIDVGQPKANAAGIQRIMSWLRTRISVLNSLSAMNEAQYYDYLFRVKQNFATNLMINRINYGITINDYDEICDDMQEIFEPFLTSAIKGGHRRAVFHNSRLEIKEQSEKSKGILGGFM